jgi:hypothetical protein
MKNSMSCAHKCIWPSMQIWWAKRCRFLHHIGPAALTLVHGLRQCIEVMRGELRHGRRDLLAYLADMRRREADAAERRELRRVSTIKRTGSGLLPIGPSHEDGTADRSADIGMAAGSSGDGQTTGNARARGAFMNAVQRVAHAGTFVRLASSSHDRDESTVHGAPFSHVGVIVQVRRMSFRSMSSTALSSTAAPNDPATPPQRRSSSTPTASPLFCPTQGDGEPMLSISTPQSEGAGETGTERADSKHDQIARVLREFEAAEAQHAIDVGELNRNHCVSILFSVCALAAALSASYAVQCNSLLDNRTIEPLLLTTGTAYLRCVGEWENKCTCKSHKLHSSLLQAWIAVEIVSIAFAVPAIRFLRPYAFCTGMLWAVDELMQSRMAIELCWLDWRAHLV